MSNTPIAPEEKKGFFQNDKLLVCSMLTFYGLCIIGLIVGAFVWLGDRAETIKINATATEAAIATERANTTATAVAHVTEQAQYGLIERFDNNKHLWRARGEDSEYWSGSTKVSGGVYIWDVKDTKKTFISWADFPISNYMRDFDVYADTKILDANPGDACSGFQFRVSTSGWDDGGYYFALCNDASVRISYHTETDGWERIATRIYQDYSSYDWNRMEISARGTHFKFFINGKMVYEMDDERRESGGLALVIELNEKVPATIWFDNFGLQRR